MDLLGPFCVGTLSKPTESPCEISTLTFERGGVFRGHAIKNAIVILTLLMGAILSSAVLAGCSSSGSGDSRKGLAVTERTIEQVQEAHTKEWMTIPGVEGTGIGLCKEKPCIIVFASKTAEELKDRIPSSVEGYPVTIRKSGTFRALD